MRALATKNPPNITWPLDKKAVHIFDVHGSILALDVHSANFIEIDEAMATAIKMAAELESSDLLRDALVRTFSSPAADSLVGELEYLIAEKVLFTEEQFGPEPLPPVGGIATVSVNLSQKCNLNCGYCFADGGSFGQKAEHMTVETGRQTTAFLFDNCGVHNEVSICFFGGEPLLNFDVMKDMVISARKRAKALNKKVRFNITTNGTKLTDPVRRYLKENNFGVIVSIDGGPTVQDKNRPFANGKGTYNTIRKHLDAALSENEREELGWTLRSTFTQADKQFIPHVEHLSSLGFNDISVEPCVSVNDSFGISEKDLPELKKQYSQYAKEYLEQLRRGKKLNFYHFKVMVDQVRNGRCRLSQCGAGRGYLGISSTGGIYPCHRMVGIEEYKIGDVRTGIMNPEIIETFSAHHAASKPKCSKCWARYICGSGCHAVAYDFNKDISKPYEVECHLMKQRIELGAWIWSELSKGNNTSNALGKYKDDNTQII